MSEYSAEAASLVETLDSRLDARAAEYFSGEPNVEGMLGYVQVRVEGYREAVDGIEALDPPGEVADLHETFRKVLGELLVAEEARAGFAETVTSVDELDLVWEGPEAQAIRVAEEKAIVLCYAAQSQFDQTEQREAFAGVPWMPTKLREVVRVALNCP